MYYQGVNANIMSLGGIAIAIGAMVDAAVVMIENAHKKARRPRDGRQRRALAPDHRGGGRGRARRCSSRCWSSRCPSCRCSRSKRRRGASFRRSPSPRPTRWRLAAILAVTLIPVLMGYLIRGRIPEEQKNPLNRVLIALYRPLLAAVLAWPKATIAVALVDPGGNRDPATKIGGEFMPPLDEGDLLYMPSALPGLSAGKAAEILQQTDRLIRQVPEVKSVSGKIGRAETATDPAPLEMVETTIQFKPKSEWRAGMTTGEARRGARPHRAAARDCRTSGCRRSATASTCSPPASRARSASRCRARTWRRSTASPARSSAW